jgi:glutathione synthase/RimK-type ligase-like ATP-grasp enzyme
MVDKKLIIVVAKDGRPSMKGTYSKMNNDSELLVRRRLTNPKTNKLVSDYWRKYTNHNSENFNKINNNNVDFKNKIIVRWGNRLELDLTNSIVYNKSENIAKASNKAFSRDVFTNMDVNTPKLISKLEMANNEDLPIIARPHTHAKGKNFIILKTLNKFNNHFNPAKYYYSAFVNKVKEYRLHVAHGRILNYLEKPNPKDGSIAWNRALNGEAFENVKWSEYNGDVCYEAIKAVNTLGLDFGGVDVMLDANNKVWVLEVNTSPTLASSEYSMERYAKYFDWLCKDNKRREHFELKKFKKATNYAWHDYHFEDREPNKEI